MASEQLKHGRRRTNSNTLSSSRYGHNRGVSKQIPQPKSSHTSDEFLQDFLNPSFDPAAFLNATLPPLQHRGVASQDGSKAVPLAEVSVQAQTLLSQLNAHTTRLSNTLTTLTDDILRSGSRLAYEVELLRGETLSLKETMNETLQDDIRLFIPAGLQDGAGARNTISQPEGEKQRRESSATSAPGDNANPDADDPAYIKQLQTLTLVRGRLESVIKTFGDAMEFVFPPSELSVSSSFLSVSAPEPGSEQQSSEEKGQQVLKQLREEISTLLTATEDPIEGIGRAAQRIEALKELNQVWKGTAEEKGRNRFIESLAKTVEDRHRELMREMEQAARREGVRTRTGDVAAADDPKAMPGGFGLVNQLRKLRNGL